jgi:glutamate racemase
MRIGIFDSGLGGLVITKAIRKMLPQYDYVYLGDTERVPYGLRSQASVLKFTREAVEHLFHKENCVFIIIACNTASARALGKIQKEYLPKHFPDRKVLGVLIPLAEECAKYKRVGVLATPGTVASGAFPEEIEKINKHTVVFQNAGPRLVPLAEQGRNDLVYPFIKKYLKVFSGKKINALALGCTHYPIFKKEIKDELKKISPNVKIISQDEIIPRKLKKYLKNHKEIEKKISRNGQIKILATKHTPMLEKLVYEWFGEKIKPKLINLK